MLTRTILAGAGAQQATQTALDAIGQNIMGAQVEGTTRKIINQRTLVGNKGESGGMEIGSLGRYVDSSLQRDVFIKSSEVAYTEKKAAYFDRLQQSFGRFDGPDNFSVLVTTLSDAFRVSTIDPSSSSNRALVLERGTFLAQKVSGMANEVQAYRADADREISTSVQMVQDIVTQIHHLNTTIRSGKGQQDFSANTLEDMRDVLITQLSSYMNIQVMERPEGDVVISTGGGQAIVTSEPVTISYSRYDGYVSAETRYPTEFGGITVSGVDITSSFTSGRIKSLIELRDKELPDFQKELDQLAALLRDEMNEVHNQGIGGTSLQTMQGNRIVTDPNQTLDVTGSFRIALVDGAGYFNNFADISATSFTTTNELITAINSALGPNVASLDDDNRLVLKAPDGLGIAIGEVEGTPPCEIKVRNRPLGLSHYFGLNDFFVTSHRRFGDDTTGVAQMLQVDPQLTEEQRQLSFTKLKSSLDATIPPAGTKVSQKAITAGDGGLIQSLADALTVTRLNIDKVGLMGQQTTTIAGFSSALISQHAQEAKTVKSFVKEQNMVLNQTVARLSNLSGINLQEELSLLNLYRQSYFAITRLTQVAMELIDIALKAHQR